MPEVQRTETVYFNILIVFGWDKRFENIPVLCTLCFVNIILCYKYFAALLLISFNNSNILSV